MLTILAALLSISSAPQDTQTPGVAMAERVSREVEAAGPGACDAALGEAAVRNAEGLFVGAGVCTAEAKEDDAIFLLLAGQARAMADMSLVTPENLPEPDPDGLIDLSDLPPPPFEVVDLYGFIYAYAGGAGSTAFYRDVERTDRLFARLQSWQALRPPGYDPGWDGSRTIDDNEYAARVSAIAAGRKEQLSSLARLLRNDTYYALQVELESLMAANHNTFEDGTPASDRFGTIQTEQARILDELNRPAE